MLSSEDVPGGLPKVEGRAQHRMPSMSDILRRAALLARSKTLRDRATSFRNRLKDEKAKEFMKTSVFNNLDDVDQFFLGDSETRPSMEMWERMWLDSAELILSSAEQNFAKFEAQVSQYGGPENVEILG